jgi:uncharacterized membrane protein YqjE
MKTKINFAMPLVESVKQYIKTRCELAKLKAADKAADLITQLAFCLFLAVILLFFALTFNIAIALWLGELLGKNYYGFLVMATLYVVIAIVVYIFRNKLIKEPLKNFIIPQLLN